MFTDIVIFNYDDVCDRATYSYPKEYSQGIVYLINPGKIVFNNWTIHQKAPRKNIAECFSRNKILPNCRQRLRGRVDILVRIAIHSG